MKTLLKTLALALAVALPASLAQASTVTVNDFGSPLSAGDAGTAYVSASNNTSFGGSSVGFTAADSLTAIVSVTVNPYTTSLLGGAGNAITIDYAINGGATSSLALASVFGTIGGGVLNNIYLGAGDSIAFFINGSAGDTTNQVTFAAQTMAPVPLPAAGFLLLAGLGGLGVMRKRAA